VHMVLLYMEFWSKNQSVHGWNFGARAKVCMGGGGDGQAL